MSEKVRYSKKRIFYYPRSWSKKRWPPPEPWSLTVFATQMLLIITSHSPM